MHLFDWLPQAIQGPARFRFVLQPIVAILLGLRDGRLDARAGRPPYLFTVLFGSGTRGAQLKEGLHQVALPLAVGVAIDLLVQLVLLHLVYLRMAIAVGILLVGLPYAGSRGLANRAARRRLRHA